MGLTYTHPIDWGEKKKKDPLGGSLAILVQQGSGGFMFKVSLDRIATRATAENEKGMRELDINVCAPIKAGVCVLGGILARKWRLYS